MGTDGRMEVNQKVNRETKNEKILMQSFSGILAQMKKTYRVEYKGPLITSRDEKVKS